MRSVVSHESDHFWMRPITIAPFRRRATTPATACAKSPLMAGRSAAKRVHVGARDLDTVGDRPTVVSDVLDAMHPAHEEHAQIRLVHEALGLYGFCNPQPSVSS